MSDYVPTDCLAAAAGYVSREFGYGYGIRVVGAGFVNALFELHASDGSRRLFLVDRYGNVELAPLELAEYRETERQPEIDAWTMAAADRLYARRNGYAVSNATSPLEVA